MKQLSLEYWPRLSHWLRSGQDSGVYDRQLVVLALALMAVGLVMVGSASIAEGLSLHDDAFFFVKRHLFFLAVCCIMLALMVQVPMDWWQRSSSGWLLLTILALGAVLLVGRSVNGAARWIAFGPFNLQPAELAKLAFLLYLSAYLVRRHDEVRNQIKGFLKPLMVLFAMALLLLLQPDLGTVVVMFVVAIGMLFLAGARLVQFLLLAAVGIAAVGALILLEPYRLRRVTSFLDPWQDPFGSGYQLTQSLMAFGRGSWFGQGLGNSVQKLEYLPEAHTDFVMAIMAEELGFVGVCVVMGLLLWLSLKAMRIGQQALRKEKYFEGFVASGLGIWVCFQSVVNIGAAAGALPTKGLTLPLVSYGGSSLLAMSIAIAMLIRIDHELRIDGAQLRVRKKEKKQ